MHRISVKLPTYFASYNLFLIYLDHFKGSTKLIRRKCSTNFKICIGYKKTSPNNFFKIFLIFFKVAMPWNKNVPTDNRIWLEQNVMINTYFSFLINRYFRKRLNFERKHFQLHWPPAICNYFWHIQHLQIMFF